MNTNSKPDPNSQDGNDKNTDVTRSQNREGVAAAGNDSGDERMGSLAEAGNEHSQEGHTGSHQEGEYDKDHLENLPKEGSQQQAQNK